MKKAQLSPQIIGLVILAILIFYLVPQLTAVTLKVELSNDQIKQGDTVNLFYEISNNKKYELTDINGRIEGLGYDSKIIIANPAPPNSRFRGTSEINTQYLKQGTHSIVVTFEYNFLENKIKKKGIFKKEISFEIY